MIFKTRTEPIPSDDVLYDIFYHGCLKPENLLAEQEEIDEVTFAINTIKNYIKEAKYNNVIEEI